MLLPTPPAVSTAVSSFDPHALPADSPPAEPRRTDADRPVVLVVDDAPSSLGVLCDTLESAGYTVLVACDGETALARLELVTPDAILLDGLMPGLSGFDTCRRIKDTPAWAHVPVIFMTGMAETADVVEGFACGGVDYVVKPLRAQEVLARLHTHARNARISRMARDAVDVAGLGVVLVDALGRVAWHSPQAAVWLHSSNDGNPVGQLPSAWQSALRAAANANANTNTDAHHTLLAHTQTTPALVSAR